MRRTGTTLWRALLFAAAAAVVASSPPPAAAHPEYLRSDPPAGGVVEASPQSVTITFTEPVENRLLEVIVLSEGGQRVDRGDGRRLESARQVQTSVGILRDGGYSVRWRALGYDGHIVGGVFSFGVGRPPLDPPPQGPTRNPLPDALIRWVALLSGAALVGGILFRQLVLAPLTRAGALTAESAQHADHRVLTVVWAGFAVFLGASVALVAAQTLAAGRDGGFSRLADVLLGSRFGLLWIARMALLSVLGAVLAHIEGLRGNAGASSPRQRRAVASARADPGDRWWIAATAIAAALALPFSLGGHPAVAEPAWLAVPVDWAHRLAALAWVGGAIHFVALWAAGPLGRQVSTAVAPRFSLYSVATFAALVPTGVFSAWAYIPSPAETTESAYGITLLVKLGLAAPMAALGLWHLRATQKDGGSLRARTLLPEAALGALVLAAVGLLVNLPPGRGQSAVRDAAAASTSAAPQAARSDTLVVANNAGPYLVTMAIDAIGSRIALGLGIVDDVGRPVDDASVRVHASTEAGAGEEREFAARRLDPGRYAADLPGALGRWNARVSVARPGAQEEVAPFRFELPVSGARDILRRSDAAMNQITALRERQQVDGGSDGPIEGAYDYLAPDRMHATFRYLAAATPGAKAIAPEIVVALGQRFDRQGDTWRSEPWPDPRGFRWPAYTFAQTATDVRLIGIEEVEGGPHFVITFAESQGTRQTLWIDTESYLVRRQRMMAPGHYMNATFFDFNAPISVEPPDS